MIAQIRGNVVALDPHSTIIDVAGVGYLLNITASTSATLKLGADATLATAMIVREDDISLYGFLNRDEKRVFDLLRSVTGVGPKSALAVLTALGLEEIAAAVMSDDDGAFRKVSGIGPKTAKLITVTLAGKLTSSATSTTPNHGAAIAVVAALVGLGWSEKASQDAVSEASKAAAGQATNDALLRSSLSILSRGSK